MERWSFVERFCWAYWLLDQMPQARKAWVRFCSLRRAVKLTPLA